MTDEANKPEIVIESKVQIEQKYDAEGLLHNEIQIRGWEYDQAIKAKQQELSQAKSEGEKLASKLNNELNRAAEEASAEDVKTLKSLCNKLGIQKDITCRVHAGLDEKADEISYCLSFSFNCNGSGKIPATAEAKRLDSEIHANNALIDSLVAEINAMRLAKENDVLSMSILAGKAKRQMAMQDKSGRALIQGLVEAVRPQLPPPKK